MTNDWIFTNWQEQVVIARTIATIAHRGQLDKAGLAYIGHPTRVAERVRERLSDRGDVPDRVAQATAVAWLHDVLEDTDVTRDDLFDAGIAWSVISDVEKLTHLPGQSIEEYFETLGTSPLACDVKLDDIADNSDTARLALLEDSVSTRLRAKYSRSLELLEQRSPEVQ